MQGFVVDLDELERCRKVIQGHAEQFGDIRGGFAATDVNASPFGTLPAAIRLAGAYQELHTAARNQFSAAQEFLFSVGQRLGNVRGRMVQTEISNANALKTL